MKPRPSLEDFLRSGVPRERKQTGAVAMSLTDVMSHAELDLWAQVSLVMFLGVFVVVSLRTWRSPRDERERASRIPVDGD